MFLLLESMGKGEQWLQEEDSTAGTRVQATEQGFRVVWVLCAGGDTALEGLQSCDILVMLYRLGWPPPIVVY